MVDWTDNRLNHKFWVMVALLQTLDTENFSFCDTTYEGSDAHNPRTTPPPPPGNGIFAQGLSSSRGSVLLLINTKATNATVMVPDAVGKEAKTIDMLVGNEAARESTLASDTVELGSFAVTFVKF